MDSPARRVQSAPPEGPPMSATVNREIHLKSRPVGTPTADNFHVTTSTGSFGCA